MTYREAVRAALREALRTDPRVFVMGEDVVRYASAPSCSVFHPAFKRGIGHIAAAFYPKPVIVRTSDVKTNEYARVIGGRSFEPAEENPMLGFRGASRYYDARYADGFALECADDLTQLVLGIDRDSAAVAHLFDERNEAVRRMIATAIEAAKRAGKPIGICGQAPSDYPEFAAWLVEQGIDSISLNPDAAIKTTLVIAAAKTRALGHKVAGT